MNNYIRLECDEFYPAVAHFFLRAQEDEPLHLSDESDRYRDPESSSG